ncbi:peptidoglycan editing factor PgeF [Idiomarina aminovorans]|uniref:peptidoglycan editing factor PgeF n=1 Tax=Idiomarina aminovorans TaxID=2914829 RepID=UPI00200595EC|nr:peptidoglycan editing factor PgeF [Idiomarina sp. ATCH4]MCK7459253.1 peptidoglycan editing factor PgeF [Idiomarina sp. ATCH4]
MNVSNKHEGIVFPDWKLPSNVHAAVTTRAFGNLAAHVGDDPAAVILRRRQLQRELELPEAVTWLQQKHTNNVLQWPFKSAVADAAYSDSSNSVCAVLTADCLPILCCSDDGKEIAAVHAGWRGLAGGVLQHALSHFQTAAADIRVWIGPAIGAPSFDVGNDVREAFVACHASNVEHFTSLSDKWLADLSSIAVDDCLRAGVKNITRSEECTARNNINWYSWRKEKAAARFASIIWRN